MRRFLIISIIFLSQSVARADLLPFGTASGYNEFVLGNSTRSNVDSQGAVAVGGTATFTGFTIDNYQNASNALVVGNTLTFNASYGNIDGNVKYGVNMNGTGPALATGNTYSQGTPINFATESTKLLALSSAQLGSGDTNVVSVGNAVTFAGSTSATANTSYFDITAANFSGNNTYNISGSANATVVINITGNVSGGILFQNAGFNLTGGITSDHIVYNFIDATSLTVGGIGVDGSILAPKAAVSFSNGHIDGNLIASSLTGSGESHYYANGGTSGPTVFFDGSLRPLGVVPEPTSMALLAIGCVGGGVLVRRKKEKATV